LGWQLDLNSIGPAKNTHDGWVNTRIFWYELGLGKLPANLNGYERGYEDSNEDDFGFGYSILF